MWVYGKWLAAAAAAARRRRRKRVVFDVDKDVNKRI